MIKVVILIYNHKLIICLWYKKLFQIKPDNKNNLNQKYIDYNLN